MRRFRFGGTEIVESFHQLLTGPSQACGHLAGTIQMRVFSSCDEPGKDLEIQEEIEKHRGLLSQDERGLVTALLSGRTWKQIVADSGQKADALRMKLMRAFDRIRDI